MTSAGLLDDLRADGVRWLTLDRPARLNAFTVADYRDLRVALERCAADSATRVVVLTGSGRAFFAGADRPLLDLTASEPQREQAGDEFSQLLATLGSFEKPLLAAVNGLAVGFGCTMLLYFDVVFLAETARLRLPFTALGIVPEAASSALLPLRAPWPDAMWAMLSSEWIDAGTAVRMGLALRSVADENLAAEVEAAAAVIAAHDPDAVAATKRLLTAGRAELARRAIERELDEMRGLHR